MKHLWPVGFLLITACSEPRFGFRGFTDLSDCRSVIDSELLAGAEFVNAFDTELPAGEGVVTELAGELSGMPVDILVSCYRGGQVGSVDYIADAGEPEQSARFFMQLATELDTAFGTPFETLTPDSRRWTFVCGDPATVVLREARLADMDYEVSLLVIPYPSEC